jgi:Xaa-Pro aminopeptidase
VRKLFAVILLLTSWSVALERQPNADYHGRRERLAKLLTSQPGPSGASGGAVLMFAGTESSTGDAIYGFRQDDNYYYLTGLSEPGSALLIVSAAEAAGDRAARQYSETLFMPARNMVQERWTGPKLGPENPEAARVTGFDKVAPLETLPRVLAEMPPMRIYADVPRWNGTSSDVEAIKALVRLNAFPNGVQPQDVKPMLGELRKVKDAGEIALIRKATDASVAAHFAAIKTMKPGITEREIASLMQYEFGKRGCERPAYAPIVGSGYFSTVLHYSEDSGTVQSGDVAVLDVGGEYSMYATDITRTLPANGKFSARQREIYDVVLGAQQAAMAAFQTGKSVLRGTSPDSLNKVAADYINSHGKDLHGDPLGKYFIHGLGHFVGLNVHDPGDATKPLDKGMVFTLEPGVYIPEEKIGVRIEDTFLVGDDGKLINLSGKLPHTADDVERAMAGK